MNRSGGKMRVIQPFAILLVSCGLASAAVVAATALVKQDLITKSGMERQVREIPGSIKLGIDQARQQGAPIDNKLAQAWAETVPLAFNADKMLAFIDKGLQKILTPEDDRLLLAHYNSPLGRKITELEVKASRPEAAAEIQAYAQKLMANPSAHANRLALYQEIDKAVGGTNMAVELAMAMQVAVQVGMVSAMTGPKDLNVRAMKAAVEKTKFALTQQMASAILASFAYTYRDLSTKELTAYLAFLNSSAGKKFNADAARLLSEAIALQTEDLGKLLAQHLNRKGI
jgi:uncharacterized protein DUF2059